MKTSNERIVMGIDPGYAILGYAVIAAQGNELHLLACGVITTPAGLVLALRLQQIYERLSAWWMSTVPRKRRWKSSSSAEM